MLKLAGADYRCEFVADLSTMPLGKVPVLEANGKLIADSELIAGFLHTQHGLDLDCKFSAEQKAAARAFRVMADEHLYWGGVYARIIDPAGEAFLRSVMLAGVPSEMLDGAVEGFRAKVSAQLDAQGLGRHSQAQLYEFCKQDVDAIADFLGGKDFLFGSEISTADCSAAVMLAGMAGNDFDTPLSLHIKQNARLTAYIERQVFGA